MSKENLYNEIKKNKSGNVDLSFIKDLPSGKMSYKDPVTWGIGGTLKIKEQKTAQSTQAIPDETTPSTAKFVKETGQGIMRDVSLLGRKTTEVVDPTKAPISKLFGAKNIFGTDQPYSLESETEGISNLLGIESEKGKERVAKTYGALNLLDILSYGTTKTVAKTAFESIAKSAEKSEISQIIKNSFRDLADPQVADNLGIALNDVTEPSQVQKIIEHAIEMERKKKPVIPKYWYDNLPKPKNDEVVVSFVETRGNKQYINTDIESTKQYDGVPQFGVLKRELLEDTGDVNKTQNGVYTIPRALANKVVMENTLVLPKQVPIRGEGGRFLGSFRDEPAKQKVSEIVEEAKNYGVRIDVNNIGKANNEIDMMVRYLNDKPEEAMRKLGYLKGMQSGGNADFVSRRLLEIKQIVQEYAKKDIQSTLFKQSFIEDNILFDRSLKEIEERLETIFGRKVNIRTFTDTQKLGGTDLNKVYGRATGDTISLLERNKTFSEAVANHEGWHWFLRNLSDSKRKELEALQKELYDTRPDIRAQVEKDYDPNKFTPEQIAEEMMAEEFARYTRTGRTVLEKLKIFFENAVEALLRVFKVRDDVMSRVEREFSKVKKMLKESGADGKGASATKQIEQKNLLAVHNLSEAKLRFADRVGGLANPSVAVINPKITGFENYGDISLIGDRNLIEGQKTHLADAYSPRFPSVHSTMKWVDFKRLEKDLEPLYKEIGDDVRKVQHDDMDMVRNIENNPAVALKFLKEKGVKPTKEGQHYFHGQIQKAGLDAEYQDFLDELYKKYNLTEQMFAGYTNAGKRRYKPVSVEEASKIMGKQKEEGFNYGLGSFRSKIAPVKKKVSDIRKQQGRLVSKEDFELVKESYDKELWALKDELEPFARKYDSNSFIESDMQLNMIGNVLTGEDVGMAAFKSKYPNAPSELIAKVLKFRDKLKDMPTEYFETKFKRPVDLSEFRIALVPEDISPQARKILENKGLRVETYAKGEKQEVMKRLLNDSDVAFKQVSNVDRLIAEGKIRVVSRDGRDIYQTKEGDKWVNRRDEDSALKSLEPKPKAPSKAIQVDPKLEERLIAAQISKEMLAEDPAAGLAKYVAKRGDFKGELAEVTGKQGSKTGIGIDVRAQDLGFKNSEEAREAYKKYRIRKSEVEVEIKEAREAIKLAKLEQKARQGESKAISELTEPVYQRVPETPKTIQTLENQAQEVLGEVDLLPTQKPLSLQEIVAQTPLSAKVNLIDYIRTPDRVLKKIGFDKEAKLLRDGYDKYVVELPKNIEKITDWFERVPKDSGKRIFQYLDGEAITLPANEQKVAEEIRLWLKEWADRLNLPEDNRITNYITHIFDEELIAKEFDEDLVKIITEKIPGQVYDPFLEKRLGAKGYIQDVWKALDAYTKRATRKVHIDPALQKIQDKAGSSLEFSNLEKSQFDYLQKYVSRVNMRPTEVDNLIDTSIKQLFGYKVGQRPVARISQFLRRMTYRSFLGLNLGSALRNLSQGINTYAVLGERDTVLGYMKLFSEANRKELAEQGIFANNFIQDRTINATRKLIEKADKGLWLFFDTAEKINRGSAYLGAKTKALRQGKTEQEAIDYAKSIVRKTQFNYDPVDTPVALGSDIVKTLLQFQTYTTKQTEFLTELAKNKDFVALARYALAGYAFVYTIGQAFGMEPKELLPINTDTWSRFELAPSLKIPKEIAKALMNVPDDYGSERDFDKKMKDVAETLWGLIPGGAQLKKTIRGYEAVQEKGSFDSAGRQQFEVGGTPTKDTQAILFGKYANKEAKNYFDKKTGDETLDELKKADNKKKADEKKKLAEDVAELSKASKQEVMARIKEIGATDPEYAEKVIDALTEKKLGLTPTETKLKNSSVMVRAEYISARLEDMSKEERADFIQEYSKKGILTEDVLDALIELRTNK